MDIKAEVSLEVNGVLVTARQLEALLAVQDTGSQAAAAKRLGISAPVLNKYISAISAAAGTDVLKTTPAGSKLSLEGEEIAYAARYMSLRCDTNRSFTICCSPVTEELVLSALSSFKTPTSRVVISDDENSIRMMQENRADFAIIDDPLYLFDIDEFEMQEISYMGMVFVDNGPSFIKYRYGAQRVAYMFLESAGHEYSVDGETASLKELLGSGKSFFVDEIMLSRRNIRYKSAVDPKMLRHAVTAIYRRETRSVSRLLRAIRSRTL